MISVVIPIFNEEESISHFYVELERELGENFKNHEIIFVDDGSTDKSLELLKDLERKNKKVKIFSFRRNQGKAEALVLGFSNAKGDYIVTLDADLQDSPSEIKTLFKKAQEGWDLVCGWRKNRRDSRLKIVSSRIFNLIARKIWGLTLHDYNCGLKLYTKEAAQSLFLYGGLHRFIPLLVYEQGFSVTEVPVVHEKRKFGKSKYGLSKLWRDLPDLFTMFFLIRYGKRPLHFFGTAGILLSLLGIVILLYLYIFVHSQGQAIANRPLFFFGMILVLSGFQTLFTGFLADLTINIFSKDNHESLLKYSSGK